MSKQSRPPIPDPTVKALFARAGNHCCRCKTAITELPEVPGDGIAVIGEIAHINAISTDGPRGDGLMTAAQLNDYDNLILLCANCHTKVDRQELKYTVDELKKIKVEHEVLNEKMYQKHMPAIGFKELDLITRWLVEENGSYVDEVSLPTAPKEKMKKNELSNKSESKIRIGLLKSDEVKQYLNNKIKFDSNFAEKLKFGFVEKYAQLRIKDFKGDELFEALHLFACKNSVDYNEQCAGLAVLVYLFEACEVFEK